MTVGGDASDNSVMAVVVTPDGPSHGTCVSPYAAGWAHLEASDVAALWVIVDLRRDEVVQISTNPKQSRVSPVSGKPYPTCNEDQDPLTLTRVCG